MTIFIDSSGNIVGDALIGAKSAKIYMEELTARLESVLSDADKTAGASSAAPDSTVAPVNQGKQPETSAGMVHTDFTLNCSFQNKADDTWSEKPASFSLDIPSDWELNPPKGTGTQFFASYSKGGQGFATISLRERAAGINPMFQELFSDIDSDNASSSEDLEIAGYPAKLYRINKGSGWFVIAPNEFSDMYIEVSFISAAGTEKEMETILSTLSLE